MINTVLTPETKVLVTYWDNITGTATIAELEARFSDETIGWRNWFFASLEQQGYANGKWAVYTVIS